MENHLTVRHVAGIIWLALPQTWRWAYVERFYKRHPNLCWCDLVDTIMLDDHKGDYRAPWGCGCDVPMPLLSESSEPSGQCYCPALPEETR